MGYLAASVKSANLLISELKFIREIGKHPFYFLSAGQVAPQAALYCCQ
jgi:hypothetical protein